MTNPLKNLYNACNPLTPASPAHYMDCSAVRGGKALTAQFRNKLAMAENQFLCFLFSGHIGCGKSSELHHLARELENPKPVAPHKRYFPVILDAGEYLDDYDVTPTDIHLAIVAELAATLREKGVGELKDNYFVRRFNEIKSFFLTERELGEGELSLGIAKARIQRLKKAPEARKQVREKLLPQMTSILSEINTVFDNARLLLKKMKSPGGDAFADFVLILDNLEKIQRIAGHTEGEASQKELFIERAPQLMGLSAHVIYTIPLTLIFSHGPQLKAIYGFPPFVLPMIKIMERGTRKPYEEGRQALRDLVQHRAGDTPLESLFESEALDWLLTYSGGHTRDLMAFVQEACTYVDGPPITLQAAQRALGQTVSLYSTSIPASHWPKLAGLERSPDQDIDNNDPDIRQMLEQLTVLAYSNGGDAQDAFTPETPWYAVNPIVRELPQFKAALEDLNKVTGPAQ